MKIEAIEIHLSKSTSNVKIFDRRQYFYQAYSLAKQPFVDWFVEFGYVSPNLLQKYSRSQDDRSKKSKWIVDTADGNKDLSLRFCFIRNVSFETERVGIANLQDPKNSLYWKLVKIQIQSRHHSNCALDALKRTKAIKFVVVAPRYSSFLVVAEAS